jgi:hypothetical protein
MILMNSIATSESVPRRLPVQWLDDTPMWTLLLDVGALRPSARRRRLRARSSFAKASEDKTPALPEPSERMRLITLVDASRRQAGQGSATVSVAPIGVPPTGFRLKASHLLVNHFKVLMPSAKRRRPRTRPAFAPEGAIADQAPALPDSSEWIASQRSATVPVAPVGVPPTGFGLKAAYVLVSHFKALMPSARRRRLRARTPALPNPSA